MADRPFRADSTPAPKRLSVSLPFVAISAITLIVIGHFVKRKSGGRRLGESIESPDERQTNNEDDENEGLPLTLEELRKRRLRYIERRKTSLTPLGTILTLSHKVDELEQQVMDLPKTRAQEQVEDSMERLRQIRSQIDAIESDESVREQKKIQARRVDSLLTILRGNS